MFAGRKTPSADDRESVNRANRPNTTTQGVSILPRRNPTTFSRLSAEFQRRKAARRSHG
jgi:hypothetical protein